MEKRQHHWHKKRVARADRMRVLAEEHRRSAAVYRGLAGGNELMGFWAADQIRYASELDSAADMLLRPNQT